MMLYEWCCEPGSKLAQWFIDHGHGARRLCFPKCDMSKVEVVEAITRQMLLDERRGYTIVMWVSLSCAPWSTWQFVNAALSQETFDKIQIERELSVRMIRLMVLTMNTLAERLPAEHFIRAFEWPRGAVGWHLQDIKKVINLMPKLCEFDGCQYDVKDGKGLAVKQPWRVVTNHSPLVKALGRRCQGEHQHGQCRGPVAEASGVYKSRFAAIVGKATTGGENKAAPIAVQHHEEPEVHDHGMKEAVSAVTPKAKEVPSEEEQRVHRLTHLPYADWCRTCIQAKARDDPHRHVAHGEDEVPVVELDYMHLKTSQPEDITVPVLIGAVKGSSYGMAAKSETMGRADREAIICFCKFLQEAGLMGTLRLRSDQGPVAMAVALEVAARRHPAHTIVETTPRASHSSLGGSGRKCQTIAGQVRMLRIEVEERWETPVLATSPIMKYIIRHASWTTNRFQPTRGMTPYGSIQMHPHRGTVYGMAGPVLLRVGDLSDIAKVDSR